MTTARITVYIQALGGKFLGPNAYNTNDINLTLTVDGKTETITYEYVEGKNDGNVQPFFSFQIPPTNAQSSFLPILTPNATKSSEPLVYYLTPNNETICGNTEVDITKLEMLGTLSASIPRPEAEEDLVITESIVLNQMQSEYRPIMIVPGLLMENPPKDKVPPQKNSLFLWVKMMCGCPITTDVKKSFWLDSDFTVSAEVFFRNGDRVPRVLTFVSNDYPSLYAAPVPDISEVRMANFTARQKSTGNIGFLSVIYSLG